MDLPAPLPVSSSASPIAADQALGAAMENLAKDGLGEYLADADCALHILD